VFNSSRVERSRGNSSNVFAVLVPTILCGLIVLLAVYIDRLYSSEIDRVSEGVGMGGQTEGESPLGFHSALGQSRQPAALVRLENDFTTNPWSPMIYFREGVLSRFNGKEIVAGPTTLDADVPRISPGQPYIVVESELVPGRKEVQQSIFLLTEHKNPFALDFPISIQLLKNPDPERFNTAYQATSFAPVLNYNQMRNFAVDNPSWPKSTTEHYLRAPGSLSTEDIASADLGQDLSEPILDKHGEDLRYALMARAITASLDNPLDKARAITEFLSKVSVYTRSPGHQVTAGGDPVAAYLFAEKKRGYCVHFAHAAVYMMRLSGVPSRIATGYLTDMSYAKDGHLLLHLGDRHAWPEVYLHEYGWMAVDVSPEQAENEEPIIPDESLLEELMSKIDPGLEFLNPEDGPNLFPEDEADVLTAEAVRKGFVFSALSLLLLFFVMKLYLHYGYLLASGQSRKLALQYRAFAAQCIDIGIGRGFGETKLEHAKRLHTQEKIAGTPLAERMAELRYSKNSELEAIDTNALIKSIERSKGSIRRVLGFLNPASLFKWGRW